MDLGKFFSQGIKNTVLLKNNSGFSYNGPWFLVGENTTVDRWHVGDITSAEYTISVDYDTHNKEILKCLVVGAVDSANIHVFARSSTNIELVTLQAIVNDSYVDVKILANSQKLQTARFIYTVDYFNNQNPLRS